MDDLLSVPTDDEISREPDNVRRSILAAMQRILTGNPRLVRAGSTSAVQLAIEAGVGRHYLYRRDADLRLRFERVKDTLNRPTTEEERLQGCLDDANAEIASLKNLQSRTRAENANWKGLVDLLQRAINVLQEELRTEQIESARLAARLQDLSLTSADAPVVRLRPRRGVGPVDAPPMAD